MDPDRAPDPKTSPKTTTLARPWSPAVLDALRQGREPRLVEELLRETPDPQAALAPAVGPPLPNPRGGGGGGGGAARGRGPRHPDPAGGRGRGERRDPRRLRGLRPPHAGRLAAPGDPPRDAEPRGPDPVPAPG